MAPPGYCLFDMNDVVLADGTDALLRARLDGADLPAWASWLVNLGRTLRHLEVDPERQVWAAVSLPTRGFAAGLVAAGAVLAFETDNPPEPSPDRFASLSQGDGLTWVDEGRSLSGEFVALRGDVLHYDKRMHGRMDRRQRLVSKATTFQPADDSWAGWRDAATRPEFVAAACGAAADWFLSTSDIDTIIVGVRTEIEAELDNEIIEIEGRTGSLSDLVRPRSMVALGQHHRSAILSSSYDPDVVEGSSCHGPAIFDGTGAFSALAEEIDSPTGVLLLDRWHPRSEEGALTALVAKSSSAELDSELPISDPPIGIELMCWETWRP